MCKKKKFTLEGIVFAAFAVFFAACSNGTGGGDSIALSPAPFDRNVSWFVDEHGNDANSGKSEADPLKTVEAALNQIKVMYASGAWNRDTDGKDKIAVIVISGKVEGGNLIACKNKIYPPLELRGKNEGRKGTITAAKAGQRALSIQGAHVTLGPYLYLTGGSPGGGLHINGSTCILKGAVIEGNEVTGKDGHGGGVYVEYGTLIMESGIIRNNTAEREGGGVYVNSAQFVMTGGSIEGNKAQSDGGGVSVFGFNLNSGFQKTGGTIHNNSAAKGDMVSLSNGVRRNAPVDEQVNLIAELTKGVWDYKGTDKAWDHR